jgi:hypothetical protein
VISVDTKKKELVRPFAIERAKVGAAPFLLAVVGFAARACGEAVGDKFFVGATGSDRGES